MGMLFEERPELRGRKLRVQVGRHPEELGVSVGRPVFVVVVVARRTGKRPAGATVDGRRARPAAKATPAAASATPAADGRGPGRAQARARKSHAEPRRELEVVLCRRQVWVEGTERAGSRARARPPAERADGRELALDLGRRLGHRREDRVHRRRRRDADRQGRRTRHRVAKTRADVDEARAVGRALQALDGLNRGKRRKRRKVAREAGRTNGRPRRGGGTRAARWLAGRGPPAGREGLVRTSASVSLVLRLLG